MRPQLSPEKVALIATHPNVHNEFSQKVRELDRRLQMNGMKYSDWDTLTDHQHDIFTQNLFLDGGCAGNVNDYVHGAVKSCGCPDVDEELRYHSPQLMSSIDKEKSKLPMTVKIGEGLDNLNEVIDLLLQEVLEEAPKDEYKPSHGGYSGSTRMQSLDFKDINWSSVTGQNEAGEEYIAWAINNRSRLPVNLDEVNEIKNAWDDNQQFALAAVKLGLKIAQAGNIKKASKYQNPIADPTDTGPKAARQDPRSQTGVDAGLNQTPKTDILLDNKRVSLKEATKGYQIEAITDTTFGTLFAAALKEYSKTRPKTIVFDPEMEKTSAEIIKLVLAQYRRLDPESADEDRVAVNNYLGLGSKPSPPTKDLKDLAFKARGPLSEDFIEQVQESMQSLFRDPDFKYEFVKQALTGEYKFKKGNPAIADWVMEVNYDNGTFAAREINDNYMRYLADKVKWNIRTGRQKAAPEASLKNYAAVQGKAWAKNVSPMLAKLQPLLGATTELDAMEELKNLGFKWLEDPAGEAVGVNGFYYRFLKKYLLPRSKKLSTLGQQEYDEIFNAFKAWARENAIAKGADPNSPLMVAGREGRLGVDVGSNPSDLGSTFEHQDTDGALIAEGVLSKAMDLLAKPIKGLTNLAKKGWDKFLDAIGLNVSAEIEIPPLAQNNKFEE